MMVEYRISQQGLFDVLAAWDGFLRKKVHLIACGGTAMTLLGVKASTKDIDFVVPNENEHEYLIKTLKQLGYRPVTGFGWAKDDGFVFDLFRGKRVHTTELLESPLSGGNHRLIKEYRHIYLGALNCYDLIISKLFRSSSADIEDCLALVSAKKDEIEISRLVDQFKKTASFDIAQERMNGHLEHFLRIFKKRGIKP